MSIVDDADVSMLSAAKATLLVSARLASRLVLNSSVAEIWIVLLSGWQLRKVSCKVKRRASRICSSFRFVSPFSQRQLIPARAAAVTRDATLILDKIRRGGVVPSGEAGMRFADMERYLELAREVCSWARG